MKVLFIVAIILIVVFIVFQIYTTMSTNKTETQAYEVIRTEENFEIRYYPAATMAMISSTSKSFRDLGSSGFGKLARYIFGGNTEKKQIAMTSPVHMEITDSSSTMAFVLPSGYNEQNIPKPMDSSINIKTSEPEYVAVMTFGGFASTESINKHIEMLRASLKEKGVSHHGNFRFLGYNPPFQLFGRRNEVIVAIDGSLYHQPSHDRKIPS
jgi:hypothetical protein